MGGGGEKSRLNERGIESSDVISREARERQSDVDYSERKRERGEQCSRGQEKAGEGKYFVER